MKTQLIELREQYRNARGRRKMDKITDQMRALADSDPDGFALAMVELARDTALRAEELVLREQLKEILPAVSVSYIAKTYFGKTRQWLYQRINGSLVNGKPARLNDDERKILADAFKDIGQKLSTARI